MSSSLDGINIHTTTQQYNISIGRYYMTKDTTTKHTCTYNVTIEHDPTTTTDHEQRAMMLFSIKKINETYEASVDAHTEKVKEYVTR